MVSLAQAATTAPTRPRPASPVRNILLKCGTPLTGDLEKPALLQGSAGKAELVKLQIIAQENNAYCYDFSTARLPGIAATRADRRVDRLNPNRSTVVLLSAFGSSPHPGRLDRCRRNLRARAALGGCRRARR